MSNQGEHHRHKKHAIWWMLPFVIILLFLIYHYLHRTDQKTGKQPLSVVVGVARSSDMPVTLSGLGSVVPTDTVTVKTQINGQLQQIFFKEGQKVNAGDLLAQIDPRPYEAQLKQFEGQLARDEALLANARVDLKRYNTLLKQDSVSAQVRDTQISLVKQLEGTVKFDQGQVDNTKLNLQYCRITAPISGRVGLRQVDIGNYVQTTDPNGIVILNTINPINVVFAIPEDDVLKVMEQLNRGKTLEAKAYDRSHNKLLATGVLLTVDNQIDPTTGTVKLKAQFPNEQDMLFPNQFVNIRLLVDTLKNVTVIPTAAIQNGIQGTYVYLVGKNSTVRATPVVVSVALGDITAIKSGIVPGQSVVIEGVDKLSDGAAVKVATPHSNANTPVEKSGVKG